MIRVATQGSALGVVGVFLVVFGAGLILDADRFVLGGGLVAGGFGCFVAQRRQWQATEGSRS